MLSFAAIPLKTRLPAMIVGIGLLMSAVVGTVGYVEVSHLATQDMDAAITATLHERREGIESYYAGLDRDVIDMASSATVLAGYRRMLMGWRSAGDFSAASLTAAYVTNNPHPAGSRADLDRAAALNNYNEQHAQFHPGFRAWLRLHEYTDLFLIDPEGNIFYSVDKNTDFGRNIAAAKDGLAAVFGVASADATGAVHFSDVLPYAAAGGPAAFAARAILAEDGKILGVLAVALSGDILQGRVAEIHSLGLTGETYLVGADNAARTRSRFAGGFKVLDPLPALPQLAADGSVDATVERHVMLASGQIGTAIAAPLALRGLDWRVVVEIADSETYASVIGGRDRLILWTLAAAAVVALIGIVLARGITAPVSRVAAAVRTIAEGDLDTPIPDADRNDEVGDIAKSLDALRQKLALAALMEQDNQRQSDAQKQVVAALSVGLQDLSSGNLAQSIDQAFSPEYETLRLDFNQTVDKLRDTITMVVDTADSIRARSRDISQSSENLSARTETQAATLEQTAAALDELTASIRSAADGAREVESIVRAARTEAEDSGKVVQGAVAAMTEIERSSDQISQIIGVIDDIAFQTNLLALNAGVEAARAGDAGRGFAVVAAEVRALAQRSSAAAREIKSLISASTQHVGRGVDQVGRAGVALDNIVSRVGHISNLVSNIASAAAEQSTGLVEINLGVTQLDQVTQQNAAMVGESTAASQSLNQEAASLAALVAQFNIRKTATSGVPLPQVVDTATAPDLQSRLAAAGRSMWQDF